MAKKSVPSRSAPKPAARKRPRSEPAGGVSSIPKLLFAQASPHSIGGVSMFDVDGPVDSEMVENFMSDDDLINRCAQALADAGFQVLGASPYTINIAAPISTYERAFKTSITAHELPTLKNQGVKDTATYFSTENTSRFGLIQTAGTAFEDLIEGVAIEVPRYYFAANALAPKKAYWHLAAPHDVSLGCNADKAHRAGITGKGVKVAMVDSGHFAHPFFAARGYRVHPVTLGPGTVNAGADDNGHGTAESANIFAVAPDAELWPVKMSFANSLGSFNAAVALAPDIITCSWGSDIRTASLGAADMALAVSVADAVARGITVVFSAGNGHFGFPGQHPDVISAGGVFMDAAGALRASDYASGFSSLVYPGRNAPDLCGLVGMKPKAAYIMLPLQPGCAIDTALAGAVHPNGDETPNNDGWAAISGTSAAAPQLAGTAALIKQACPRLTPAEVRDIMVRTAIDVTTGNCNTSSSGAAAGPGNDLATGAGLVDAHAAVLVAKVRCLGGIRPPIRPPITPPITPPIRPPIRPPITPITPITPIQPIQPIQPIRPIRPVQPVRPVQPIRPVRPVQPIQPIQPVGPANMTNEMFMQPGGQADGQPAPSEGAPLTMEDIAALEEMVIKNRLDPL